MSQWGPPGGPPPGSRIVVGGIVVDSNGTAGPHGALPPGYPPPGYPLQQSAPPGYPPPQGLAVVPPAGGLQQQISDGSSVLLANPGLFGTLGLLTSGGIVALAITLVTALGLPPLGVFLSAGLAATASGGGGLWLLAQRGRLRGKVGVDPALQQRLLQAAAQSGGRLTVTGTAHALGITLEAAEAALTALSRSGYVDADLEPSSGVIVYVFREMAAHAAPRSPG